MARTIRAIIGLIFPPMILLLYLVAIPELDAVLNLPDRWGGWPRTIQHATFIRCI